VSVVGTIILVGWAFWIYWIAAAAGTDKAGRTMWGRFAGIPVAIVLIGLFVTRVKTIKQTITDDHWLQTIGLVIFVLGMALAIWARLYLGRNWGRPMSQKADPHLVTTGPYKNVRHPIYSGLILALIGTALAISWYLLIAVVLIGPYFIYSAVIEDRQLGARLPDTYPDYKESTQMLVPFIF
jgi:protein-S-isoprenylcysteine O-methyltransferase Ste14